MDWGSVGTVALISLLGAISPGPDFAVVMRTCLSGTFRAGVLTAFGIACALLVHVSYCLFGIAVVIQESPHFFLVLKYLGAGYLFYLGVMLLREKMSPEGAPGEARKGKKGRPFLSGFLCNLLNPKATLFMLSIFTQFVDPKMGFAQKALLGGVFVFVAFAWFALLSYLITHRLLQKHFSRFQMFITKAMGVVLCILAIYVAIF